MRKSLLLLFALVLGAALFVQQANAQVTTNSGSGLAPTYTSLANAIAALNAATMSTPVVITLSGNETAPSGGFAITQLGGTAVASITIQGSSSTITASAAQVAGNLNDAIFKIIGGDYITLQNFTMVENAANTTSAVATNNMTEFGVALFYASLTDGAQHNTIKNNFISLNRIYYNTFGIYSNTRHSATDVITVAEVTAASGSNSFNKVYGNTISNVNMGVVFIGAGTTIAAIDDGNDIGGSSIATGNTVNNFGGGAALSLYVSMTLNDYGIYTNQQINDNISFNSITSASDLATTTVSVGGILKNYSVANPVGTITTNINSNTVSITDAPTTGGVIGINNQGLAALGTATQNINNNTILNCVITGALATTASISPINNLSAPGILNINNNIIYGNSTTATGGGFSGIYNGGAVVTALNINNNQIGNASGGAITLPSGGANQVIGIFNAAGALTCAVTINSNNLQGFIYGGVNSGLIRAINHQIQTLSVTINTNNFNNLTFNSSAANAGFLIYASSATPTVTITGNFVTTQCSNICPTGAANHLAVYNTGTPATGVSTISNNNFSNITFNTTSSFGAIIYWNVGSVAPCTHNLIVTGNTISNIGNVGIGMSNQAANVYGMLVSNGYQNVIANNLVSNITVAGGTGIGIFAGAASVNAAGTMTINNNTVYGIKSTSVYGTAGSASAGGAQGMQIQSGPAGVNVFKNKIYDISCVTPGTDPAGTSLGIIFSQGTATSVNNIYNNYVGRIYSDNSTYFQSVRGIILNQALANTTNIFYNTVYLDGFPGNQSYCFYKSSALSNVVLRNNIFSNDGTSAGGAGTEQMAYFFIGALGTTYSTVSNNNLLYCGIPGAYNLIYADGSAGTLTNKKQTLADFQTFVGPTRENLSKTESVPFQNILTGVSANYLHISSATPTYCESNAVNIATYVDDYDANIRQGNPGYSGTGTAPDIGADEFGGMPKVPCAGQPAAANINGASAVCTGTGTTLTLSTNYTDIGITYQWAYATTPGGPYTNLGILPLQVTDDLTVTTYFICTITCVNSGLTRVTPEHAITINQYPTATAALNSPICEGATINLTGTTDFGTSFSWAGPNNFTAATLNTSVPSATTAAYGTYRFTATSADGCSTTGTALAIVNAAPGALTVTPTSATILQGSIQSLSVTGGVVNSIIVKEDFNGLVPGWTTVNNTTGGNNAATAWMLYLSSPTFHSNDNTNFILSDADAGGSGSTTATELISPAFSTMGYTSATFSFYHYLPYYAGDIDKIEISTDGGVTWVATPLITYTITQGTSTTWANEVIDLAAYLNQGNLKIRFNYHSIWGYYWGVDNVLITGTMTAPITWSPTANLFTDAGASVPYTGTPATALWAKPPTTVTYTATATAPAGCTSSGTSVITVNPLVPANTTVVGGLGEEETGCYNATNTITVAGGSTTFTVAVGGNATFIAGVKISFLPGTTVVNGGYLLGKISTGTYCGGIIGKSVVASGVEPTAPNTIEQANFTIFPNPTSGNFTLVQKGDRQYGSVKVEIYTMRGDKVLTSQMIGEKTHEFATSDLPVGLYFVKVIADDYTETIKLIRSR